MATFDQLTGSLEDNVLTVLVWDEQHCHTVSQRVPADLYSTRAYQRIAAKAVEYIQQYGYPPRAHIRDIFDSELQRGEEGRFLAQIIDAMEVLYRELRIDYVVEQLDRFIQLRQLTQLVARSSDNLYNGDLEAALQTLGEVATVAPPATNTSLALSEPNWLSFLNEEETDLFSSGVGVLDERNVRPRRGGLFLTIGTAGAGKSWWLIEIGKSNLVQYGRNVLHVTLENDLEETAQRYTQSLIACTETSVPSITLPLFERDKMGRLLSINSNTITPESLESLGRAGIIKGLKPFQRRGRLIVQWYPSGTLTIAQLANSIEILARTQNFRPDLIVVDYASLMHIDARDLRISMGRNLVALRGLAGKYNAAMVTASQGNRHSATARLVGTNLVAEDWSQIGTADTICTYSQTLDERDSGIARILVGKSRRSRDKWIAWISQSYATGQFCIDSCYFNKLTEKMVSRYVGSDDEGEVES